MSGSRKKTTQSKKYIILPSSLPDGQKEEETPSEFLEEEKSRSKTPTRAVMPDTSFLEPEFSSDSKTKNFFPKKENLTKSTQLSLFLPKEEETKVHIPDLSLESFDVPENSETAFKDEMPEIFSPETEKESLSDEKEEQEIFTSLDFIEEEESATAEISPAEKKQWTHALATLEINSEELARLEKEEEEEEWTEEDNVEEEEWQRRIEALLFHWNEPLSLQKLKECVGFKGANQELRQILLRYQQKILEQEHSFELLEIANGFIFKSKIEYSRYLRRLTRASVPFRPSQAVLETLSIIAYKQPVKRSVVENIRGVSSSQILNTLLERNLVQVLGRAKGPGNPKLYGTTDEFLNLFGLKSLEDLPQPEKDF